MIGFKRFLRICFICIMFVMMLDCSVNAFSFSSKIDDNEIENFKELEYKIEFDEKVLTSDFEVNYNASLLEFLGSNTENVEYSIVKDKIHVLYVDESGIGTSEIRLKFKYLKNFDNSIIGLNWINAYTINEKKSYSIEDKNKLDDIVIQNYSMIENSNNLTADVLPDTGNTSIYLVFFICVIIIILLVVINIFIKKKYIMMFILCTVVFPMASAEANNLLTKYSKVYEFENIIGVVLDKGEKNIVYNDVLKNLKIENVNGDDIFLNNKIITEDEVCINNKIYKIFVYGDVNKDGEVNSNDIAEIIENNLGNKKLEGVSRKAANLENESDINDEKIDSMDVKRLKEFILCKLDGTIVKELPKKDEEIENYLEKIEIINLNKNKYEQNEKLDINSFDIVAIYADGEKVNIEKKYLQISTEITALNNSIDNLSVLGTQKIYVKYLEEYNTREKIELNCSFDIDVSVSKHKAINNNDYEINKEKTKGNVYDIAHYTNKAACQGACRFKYNNNDYIMLSMIKSDIEETSLYILNDKKEVLWVISDKSYGHSNSIIWNYNEKDNYIYIRNTYSEDDGKKMYFIDRIDVNVMMKKLSGLEHKTVIVGLDSDVVDSNAIKYVKSGFSDEFVKRYVKNEESNQLYDVIAFDPVSNKIMTLKRFRFLMNNIEIYDEINKYVNETNNLEGICKKVNFSDTATIGGFCISDDYIFVGRFDSCEDSKDEFLNEYYGKKLCRRNYIDVYKRQKYGEKYVYTYLGTYVINNDLIKSERNVANSEDEYKRVGELESLIYVNKDNLTNEIILEAYFNEIGEEKYMRFYLNGLE